MRYFVIPFIIACGIIALTSIHLYERVKPNVKAQKAFHQTLEMCKGDSASHVVKADGMTIEYTMRCELAGPFGGDL